jgi:tetratricopeptide (TPR) repeat protein
VSLLEAEGDDAGLVHVYTALGEAANHRGRWAEQAQSVERAVQHGRLAGRLMPPSAFGSGFQYLLGLEPADELLRKLDKLLQESSHPGLLLNRARVLAMLDRLEEAWPLAHEASDRLRELTGGGGEHYVADVATLAGDHGAAARYLRVQCDRLEALHRLNNLSTYAPMLGRSLCALGRYDEAEPLARQGRELGHEQDRATQMLWRQVQALVDADRGEHAEAEQLAREAIAIIERTDGLTFQGDALSDLAEVLTAGGRSDEAAAALEQALDRYERKRNLVLARRTRARLAELQAA